MCGPFFKPAANRADTGSMDAGDGHEVAQRTREKSGFGVTLTAFGGGDRRRTGASRERPELSIIRANPWMCRTRAITAGESEVWARAGPANDRCAVESSHASDDTADG
jgi:hypothetical protein